MSPARGPHGGEGSMNVEAYLDRIGLAGPIAPDLEGLERLQRAHLSTVPFENLDVYARRGVSTDDAVTVDKVVARRRGGWCFELNGAFAALLASLGYHVERYAATVLSPPISPIPTHLTLQVTLDRPYLVDVGFGDSFIRPLPLDSPGPHDGGSGRFRFAFERGVTTLFSLDDEGTSTPQFRFASVALQPDDFEEASNHLQTAPGLRWTKTRFATRLIDGGPDRVTLLEDEIKFRRDGVWVGRPVAADTWPGLLAEWFDLSP
ncbi:MAG TPA: arylamine N-acetyltransferase [Acidimicrobiia bacterium]|nr:arylamine N-acetyltransferase [Acidimicrobiia bacterium]